ncbi:MAG: DoxX family membrane protein [bacterium]|nr:DoxX family membrane protein [bacterium]
MEFNSQIAEFLVRIFLGILFFFQGYDKLFGIKMAAVIRAFQDDANRNHIPRPILVIISYYTSLVELVGGLLLLLGLYTNYSLYLLGSDLLLVCCAFTYMQPMWNMKYVFPRFVLLIFLLMLPESSHHFSLDHFFMNK